MRTSTQSKLRNTYRSGAFRSIRIEGDEHVAMIAACYHDFSAAGEGTSSIASG